MSVAKAVLDWTALNHAWFMAMPPRSNNIIGMAPMQSLEGNEVAIILLKSISDNYPKAKVLINDCACQEKGAGNPGTQAAATHGD